MLYSTCRQSHKYACVLVIYIRNWNQISGFCTICYHFWIYFRHLCIIGILFFHMSRCFQNNLEKLRLTFPCKNHFFFIQYAQKYRLEEERTKHHQRNHHAEKSWTMSFRKCKKITRTITWYLFFWIAKNNFLVVLNPSIQVLKKLICEKGGYENCGLILLYLLTIFASQNRIIKKRYSEQSCWKVFSGLVCEQPQARSFRKVPIKKQVKYNKTSFHNISESYVLAIPCFISSKCLKIMEGL